MYRPSTPSSGRNDDFFADSPQRPITQQRTVTVPRGQNRPNVLVTRNRQDIRSPLSDSSSREAPLNMDLDMDEDTSPTFPPASRSIRTPSGTSSTPENSTPYGSRCNDTHTQVLKLQRQIALLADKIDQLQDSPAASTQVTNASSKQRNLPRDMVACVHKVVAKLKEKDPPTEWTLEPNNRLDDEANEEVTMAVERGVRATSAFKEADPVLLERAIKTYFKTLKARRKKALTRRSIEGLPEVNNKLEESVIMARRNQRLHNKLKARKEALIQSSYSEEKKRHLMEVLTVDYMSPEESEYEESDENSDSPQLSKLIIRKLQWRSDELTRELKSLDRKSYRSKSQRARRMMVKREVGGFIADSLHSHPSGAPAWALVGSLIPRR